MGDASFVGDTLFMPDLGSACCDSSGGCDRTLYRSVQRVLSLPDDTRMFMCHDYKTPERNTYEHIMTVGEQKTGNIHVGGNATEETFFAMRTLRDATLAMLTRISHRPPASLAGWAGCHHHRSFAAMIA